jgi:hypothetical protein
LAERFFGGESAVNDPRLHLEGRAGNREKSDTSDDLPLSNECKRILAYAVEEAERLNDRRIGTEHLLLGILRQERCAAAQILYERGLRLNPIREELAHNPMPPERTEMSEGLRGILSTANRILSAPDIVPDADTAKRIAQAVWTSRYRPETVAAQGTLLATLTHVWVVTASRGPESLYVFILPSDGRIQTIGRGQPPMV